MIKSHLADRYTTKYAHNNKKSIEYRRFINIFYKNDDRTIFNLTFIIFSFNNFFFTRGLNIFESKKIILRHEKKIVTTHLNPHNILIIFLSSSFHPTFALSKTLRVVQIQREPTTNHS